MKIITIESPGKILHVAASAVEAFRTEQVWHDKYNLIIALAHYREVLTYTTEEAANEAEAELFAKLTALSKHPAGN